MSVPAPSPEHLAKWWRLVRSAIRAVDRPSPSAAAILRAAKSARQARASVGGRACDQENIFIRLNRLAFRFAAARAEDRHYLAPELKALAEECMAALKADERTAPVGAAPTPRWRSRADVGE